ncbi:serine/threonine-protein phosphatase 1 regulatory subunit 10 [Phlebotomus argentipes]|uniref:serine/threonine-protein phosphatase 1 regulatory subunit 10 n=1 Tax=Phlebotomus argentipes TaxID=94469 RepID=UPI002892E5D5|nr:serine/threonine-protein phosphatase 1 regulatory subunit 10 [Phlebotomus argentipes]XP_059617159.1 serine/threonine-protein phosphatase 1 regulatory subunit 10 [Phlebotomus argentipes]
MPRIDPLQLLTCLGVLLAPNGGIRSAQEVRRLAGLMAKFSNRLVSKCIYIQILKCTDTELLGQFMGTGGWTLTHMWLQDGILTKNYPLVQEILELLLLCPVDVDRLKSNSAPKLVKQLSKESHEGVRILASKLVEQWLKIVKGEAVGNTPSVPQMNFTGNDAADVTDVSNGVISQKTTELYRNSVDEMKGQNVFESQEAQVEDVLSEKDIIGSVDLNGENGSLDGESQSNVDSGKKTKVYSHKNNSLVYKITVKDGKQVLAKVETPARATSPPKEKDKENQRVQDKEKDKLKSKRDDRDKSKSKDKKSDKEREKQREKDKKSSHRSSSSSGKSSSSSSSHKSSSSSSSGKSSSRDKDRDRSKSSSSSSKSSSSREKDKDRHRERSDKEKVSQAEKDKDTLAKIMGTGHLEKLGKIPKKTKNEGDSSSSTKDASKESKSTAPAPPPAKKASISIEQRKDGENRPNTVKKFNSQFRSHGLEEAPPPPASRRNPKKPDSTAKPLGSQGANPAMSTKSTSESGLSGIPEKKLKLDVAVASANSSSSSATAVAGEKATPEKTDKPQSPEKVSIKAPPAPRPKQSMLVETDVFMDALCSTASTNRKDLKKRKRRSSSSKDGASSNSSPPESPTVSSNPKVAPLKFYQDTLEVSEEADKEDEKSEKTEEENGRSAVDPEADDDDVIKNKRLKSDKANSLDQDDSVEGKKKASRSDKEENDAKEATNVSEEEVKPKPPGPGCGPDGPPGVLVIHRRKGPKKSVKWKPQEELEQIQYFELDETERVNVTKTFTDMKQMERYGEREAFLMARKLSADDVMMEQTPYRPLVIVDDVPPHPMGAQSKEKKIQMEREQTVLKALYFNRMMIPDSPAEPDMEQYKITDPAIIPLDDGNPENENDFTNTPWPDPKDTPPHVSGGLQADQAFNQFNMMTGGPQAMPPNPWQMGAPPFAQFNMAQFAPQSMDQGNPMAFPPPDEMNVPAMNMGPFPGAPNPNFMPGPGVPFNGFPGDMGGQMMGMNMPRGPPPNMPPGAPWFRPNAPPNWRPPPPNRNNWVHGNSRGICKLYKKGFCKKGDKCNFLHTGGNRR